MEDPAVVSIVDRPADGHQHPRCLEPRHGPLGQPPRECGSLDVLHGEEGLILLLPHLKHRHDVGMREVRGGHRLHPESLHVLRGGA